MTPEIIIALVVAVLGGGGLGALLGRKKMSAESEAIRMTTADQLITTLSLQFSAALVRISDLEKSERALQDELHHIKWFLHEQGIEIPPVPRL
jgi:hypothetical protein